MTGAVSWTRLERCGISDWDEKSEKQFRKYNLITHDKVEIGRNLETCFFLQLCGFVGIIWWNFDSYPLSPYLLADAPLKGIGAICQLPTNPTGACTSHGKWGMCPNTSNVRLSLGEWIFSSGTPFKRSLSDWTRLFWCGRLRQFETLSVARPFCVSANLRRSITMQFLGSHVCEI